MHAPAQPIIQPETLLLAYRSGIFPMADGRDDAEIFYVEPRNRAILPLGGFRCSRSLAKLLRQIANALAKSNRSTSKKSRTGNIASRSARDWNKRLSIRFRVSPCTCTSPWLLGRVLSMDQMDCLETQVLLARSHRDNSKWVAQQVLIACSEVDQFNPLKLKTKATRLLC